MNEQEQRDFIHFLAREMKAYSRELMVYQLLAHLLKHAGVSEVDALLEEARKSPGLQARFEKNFEGFDKLLPPPDPGFSDRAKELLEKWKPKVGPLN
jgi:hypothetical protein